MIRFSAQVASVAIALCSTAVLAAESPDVPPAAPLYAVTPPKDFADVKLATAGTVGGQSVAVNPKNPNVFVAAYANQGSCWVRTSTNAGQTWAAARKLPMPQGKPDCKIPALTWAPDGSRVYAAYAYRVIEVDDQGIDTTKETGALVGISTDNGRTWAPPNTAALFTDIYDHLLALKLATPLRPADARWVYLLIYQRNDDEENTYFTRSANRGQSWTPLQELIYNTNFSGANEPSIFGGTAGEILIAWGYKDCEYGPCLNEIQVNRSSDHGATFQRQITAVPNTFGETAVAFGSGGTAHLVYLDEYNGRASYIYSTKAPYTAWSQPVVLSDDISASAYYYPALTVSACGSGTSVLHAVWLDDRAGPEKYNVYYTRKVAKTGENWSRNLRVSETTPVSEYGYPLFRPAIAAGVGTAVGLWGQSSDYYGPRPVFASRIAPGVTCP